MFRDSFRTFSLLLTACALALSVACHKKPPVVPAPPPPPPPQAVVTPPPPPPPRVQEPTPPAPPPALTARQIFDQKTLAQLNAEKPLDDVFFDLDKSDLSDKSRASLQKDAEWMKQFETTRVTVEGHADSRGTNEYNLALGERRASATRDYLVTLGLPTARISIVSKGKEQPFCGEENEACWSQNRRGHFIITAK